MKKIKIKYFGDVEHVQKIPQGDWIDLRAAQDVEMKAGEFKLIPLGVGMILPKGYEAHVLPRSSTFKKWHIILANSQGVIDHSYCGNDDQWYFPAIALEDAVIKKNDRICQFRIEKVQPKVKFEEVDYLEIFSRGGLGSTGTN